MIDIADAATVTNTQDGGSKVSVENLQRMLQQQANALIELGYDPSLKVCIKFYYHSDYFVLILGTTEVHLVYLFGVVHEENGGCIRQNHL